MSDSCELRCGDLVTAEVVGRNGHDMCESVSVFLDFVSSFRVIRVLGPDEDGVVAIRVAWPEDVTFLQRVPNAKI